MGLLLAGFGSFQDLAHGPADIGFDSRRQEGRVRGIQIELHQSRIDQLNQSFDPVRFLGFLEEVEADAQIQV